MYIHKRTHLYTSTLFIYTHVHIYTHLLRVITYWQKQFNVYIFTCLHTHICTYWHSFICIHICMHQHRARTHWQRRFDIYKHLYTYTTRAYIFTRIHNNFIVHCYEFVHRFLAHTHCKGRFHAIIFTYVHYISFYTHTHTYVYWRFFLFICIHTHIFVYIPIFCSFVYLHIYASTWCTRTRAEAF